MSGLKIIEGHEMEEPTREQIVELARLAIEAAYAPAVDARAPYAKHMSKKAAEDTVAIIADMMCKRQAR